MLCPVDGQGVEHAADTIVLVTGVHILDLPTAKLVRGRDGVAALDVRADVQEAYTTASTRASRARSGAQATAPATSSTA